MTAAVALLTWLLVAAVLMSRPFIRRRRDAWPLVAIWPVLLSYVVAILVYEGLYRLAVSPRRKVRP